MLHEKVILMLTNSLSAKPNVPASSMMKHLTRANITSTSVPVFTAVLDVDGRFMQVLQNLTQGRVGLHSIKIMFSVDMKNFPQFTTANLKLFPAPSALNQEKMVALSLPVEGVAVTSGICSSM